MPSDSLTALWVLIANLFGFGGSVAFNNILLMVLAVLALIRTFRKAAGQQLLVDEATWNFLKNLLSGVATPQAPPPVATPIDPTKPT